MRSPRPVVGPAAVALLLCAAGCGLLPGGGTNQEDAGPSEDQAEVVEQAAADDGPWTVELPFAGEDSRARFDIEPVQRREDRTVLRFTLTAEDDTRDSILTMNTLSTGLAGHHSVRGLRLLDPVGQRYYYPLNDADGSQFDSLGTELPPTIAPGIHYQMEIHYPRLPDENEHVTLLPPLQTGPLTGLPVVDAETPQEVPTADAPGRSDVEPGETVELPVKDEPMGDPEDDVYDLYGITEGTVERDSSAAEEQIALRADVLFEFDEDTLEDDAGDILDDIAAETAERADPDQPPISIVGHTDGVGEDDYNQDLSERRAEAVRDYLEAELGSGYTYETEGRGSEEPVAEEGGDDDEEARERNRRVEISYHILEEYRIPDPHEDTEAVEEHGGRTVSAPGPLDWAEDGAEEPEVVGTLSGESGNLGFEMDVHPFRRDGAYLVAEFTLTHTGALYVNAMNYFGNVDYIGAEFGGFSAVNPDTGEILRAVRIGQSGDAPGSGGVSIAYVSLPGFPADVGDGAANHGYFYMPAPPPDVEALTFDAGTLGTLEDVPIR
jgi:outer membrane protein OmpA-like peptidoglycan-associated protein